MVFGDVVGWEPLRPHIPNTKWVCDREEPGILWLPPGNVPSGKCYEVPSSWCVPIGMGPGTGGPGLQGPGGPCYDTEAECLFRCWEEGDPEPQPPWNPWGRVSRPDDFGDVVGSDKLKGGGGVIYNPNPCEPFFCEYLTLMTEYDEFIPQVGTYSDIINPHTGAYEFGQAQSRFLDALMQVESGYRYDTDPDDGSTHTNPCTGENVNWPSYGSGGSNTDRGDSGKAHGCLQIWENYWFDAQHEYAKRYGTALALRDNPNWNMTSANPISDKLRWTGPPTCPHWGSTAHLVSPRPEGYAFVESRQVSCDQHGGQFTSPYSTNDQPAIPAASWNQGRSSCTFVPYSWDEDCACNYSKWIVSWYLKKWAGDRWTDPEMFSPATCARVHHLGPSGAEPHNGEYSPCDWPHDDALHNAMVKDMGRYSDESWYANEIN